MGKLAASHSGTPPLRTLNLDTLPQQLGCHVGADELVRIGIVGDDVAAARDRHRVDRVRGHADGPGQLYRAVLVGVFEANVEDRRLVAAIQAFFELSLVMRSTGTALFSLCPGRRQVSFQNK